MKNKIFGRKNSSAILAAICAFVILTSAFSVVANAFYAPTTPTYGNYFNSDYDTREEVIEANRELNEEIEGEGLILLKNDNSLPIGGDLKVSVFGKNSVNVMSGGSGSGAGGGVPVTGFIEALQEEGFSVNPNLVTFYKDNNKSGPGRGSAPGNGNVSPGYNTGETPVANYTTELEATYDQYGDAAIVVFSRISGEGFDLPRTMMWDGQTYKGWNANSTQPVPGARDKYDHYLQLDQNESDLLKYLGEHFDNVIVLLNTGSQFEVGFLDDPGHYGYHENVKGCIWMGYPGSSGNLAVAKALKGEINPSGRTVDTWARDFKNDPVWQNHANNMMENGSSNKGNQYANLPGSGGNGGGGYENNYVIYKEGIYMGYRYYETRGFTEGDGAYSSAGKGKADVVYNQVTKQNIALSNDQDGDNEIHGTTTTNWDSWYNASVVYPFGYGLSYTTFDWELVGSNPENNGYLTPDGTIKVEVKVTNTGSVAGKEVVQLYYTAPYYTGGIEKAHVVLGEFTKTKLLEPGESEIVTIEMTARDMSSYDWNDANNNGFKGYELEAGNYEIKLMKDAHTVVHTINCSLVQDISYPTSETTGYPIENRFDNVSNYLLNDEGAKDGVGYMTRADFAGTFPTMAYKITASSAVINGLAEWDKNCDTPDRPWYTNVMPTTGANNGIKLQDLVAVDFDDNLWESYMDQFTVDQLRDLAMKGGYGSGQNYSDLGVTRVPNADGPAGWLYGAPSGTYSTWCGETVLASTWNKDLARAKGVGMGNEALWGNGSSGSKIPFWYAPAVNIHRSPFSGRNFEYYSEDGLFTGIMSAAMIDGAQSKGLICYVKHFGVNDQEANRCGLLTWLDEQAMREIYIKPWEVCVKDANTMGIMTSLNKIGTYWAGGSYELLTEILRNEWGFNGNVVTDSYSSWSHGDMMVRAGGTLALGTGGLNWGTSSATAVAALRKAAKGILYSHANSMAMNTGATPTKPRPISSFETISLKTGVVNVDYSASVANAHVNTEAYPEAKDSDIVYTIKEGSVLPEGLTLSADGIISGQPTMETPSCNFTVVATYLDYSKETTFSLSVISASGSIVYNIDTPKLPLAGIGEKYSVSIGTAVIEKPDATQEEIDRFPEITYSLADGEALPRGLKISSDGIISGTPVFECENYKFTVVASALGYKDITATYEISIYNELSYESIELPDGKFGEDYFISVANAKCAKEVTYTLAPGSILPKGLTLTPGGYIVGKPKETVTDLEITIIASAPMATPVEATYHLSIGIVFNSGITLAYGQEDSEYFGVVSATGTAKVNYSLKEGSKLPAGLTLNTKGEIVGTPTEAGIFVFTITANAEGKVGDELTLTLFIEKNLNADATASGEDTAYILCKKRKNETV